MAKENDVFFGYYKSDKILGVSKSEQSDAKFLKGATSIERVEVRKTAEVQKDLEKAQNLGKLKGFVEGVAFTAVAYGGYKLVSWCCKKVKSWFKKEGE